MMKTKGTMNNCSMRGLLPVLFLIGSAALAQGQKVDPVDNLPAVSENPLEVIKETPGFAGIFREWGFVGDSLSSGEHEYLKDDGKKGYLDLYEYSWGQFICYAAGAEGVNFSKGGLTCRSWINQFWDKATADPKQAYIIALGVNDRYKKYKIGDLKTDMDPDDFNKNADTFAGNYAGIIQRLKSIRPDAKIFVATMYKKDVEEYEEYNRSIEEYNAVIRQMETVFSNVYTIDLYTYAPINDSEFRDRYYNGGHNNAAGYLYSSWIMMTYVDWIVRQDFRDFAEVALIGKGKSLYK